MPAESGSTSRRRPRYTSEFRAEAVRLVTDGGLTQAQAARDLGISAKLLSSWVRVASERSLPGAMGDAERDELKRLRKEVRTLRMERDILKRPPPSSRARAFKLRLQVHCRGEGALACASVVRGARGLEVGLL